MNIFEILYGFFIIQFGIIAILVIFESADASEKVVSQAKSPTRIIFRKIFHSKLKTFMDTL